MGGMSAKKEIDIKAIRKSIWEVWRFSVGGTVHGRRGSSHLMKVGCRGMTDSRLFSYVKPMNNFAADPVIQKSKPVLNRQPVSFRFSGFSPKSQSKGMPALGKRSKSSSRLFNALVSVDDAV